MPAEGNVPRPEADLATMLADMDSRLQMLQQELESVALPIARRPPERRAGRAAAEPAGLQPPARAEEEAAPAPATVPPLPAPRRPARRITTMPRGSEGATAAAPPDPLPAQPAARVEPVASAAPHTRVEPGPLARRPARAEPVAPAAPHTRVEPGPLARRPARTEPVAPTAPRARVEPVAPPARRARVEPVASASAPEAVVRQTILAAEEESRRIVEDARQRIAEIGARTRALLEHSLAEPPPAEKTPVAKRRRARTDKTARRAYEGTVTVEAGPFADVMQLSAFEDALASLPAADDVYIRTFERNRAHFELHLAQPTALVVELQARSADTLQVVAAGDSDLRLDIVRDGV